MGGLTGGCVWWNGKELKEAGRRRMKADVCKGY